MHPHVKRDGTDSARRSDTRPLALCGGLRLVSSSLHRTSRTSTDFTSARLKHVVLSSTATTPRPATYTCQALTAARGLKSVWKEMIQHRRLICKQFSPRYLSMLGRTPRCSPVRQIRRAVPHRYSPAMTWPLPSPKRPLGTLRMGRRRCRTSLYGLKVDLLKLHPSR